MDTRRFLIPATCWLLLSSCAPLRILPAAADTGSRTAAVAVGPVPVIGATRLTVAPAETARTVAPIKPVVAPPAISPTERPYRPARRDPAARAATDPRPVETGGANRSANRVARAVDPADAFVGAVKVFAWSPGRVFEVRTAPLRVTTLSLEPGETLVSKAAGDTIRWQIGEMTSGAGRAQQTHVVLKPLQRGLDTNLVLTTSKRIYLIDLKSGPVETFNPAVTWSDGDQAPLSLTPEIMPSVVDPVADRSEPVVTPQGEPDGRYRIEPRGSRPRWTPTAVFNDGLRTFITFDPDLQVDEAPALFVIAPDGERQLVNYRQVGGLLVVDRLFDRAELRLGDRRPQVVVLRRLAGRPS